MSNVLCIGPIYLDLNCLNFPCENGLRTEEEAIGRGYEIVPGGSAVNFARFGRSLGLDTVLLGKVGTDPFGDMVGQLLQDAGVRVSLRRDANALTDLGLNFVAPNGLSVLASAGSATELLTESDLTDVIDEHIGKLSYVYFGGSFKLPHLLSYFEGLAKDLRSYNVAVILDHGRIPKNTPSSAIRKMRSLAASVDMYFPSRDEFLAVWDADSLESAAQATFSVGLKEDRVVVVKNGSAGAVGFTAEQCIRAPAYDVEIRSTVGAGDSFNAGFIRARTLNLNLEDSLEFACASAAVKVTGEQFPTRENIARLQSTSRANAKRVG